MNGRIGLWGPGISDYLMLFGKLPKNVGMVHLNSDQGWQIFSRKREERESHPPQSSGIHRLSFPLRSSPPTLTTECSEVLTLGELSERNNYNHVLPTQNFRYNSGPEHYSQSETLGSFHEFYVRPSVKLVAREMDLIVGQKWVARLATSRVSSYR